MVTLPKARPNMAAPGIPCPSLWHGCIPLATLATDVMLGGCAGETSMLNPQGHGATQIANIWWFMLIVAAIVYVVVMGLLAAALLRRRQSEADVRVKEVPAGSYAFILIMGVVIPAVILFTLFILTLQTARALSFLETDGTLTIEVTGKRWWWEVRYADYDLVTANEIHIPVGQPVRLQLMSDNVIHSFWVPELHGKMDLTPGLTTTLWLRADRAGEYLGVCAEYCGLQHTRMQFYVVAQEPRDFDQWLVNEQQPAAQPSGGSAQRGQQVFTSTNCVYCHTVRGTTAAADVGPDLTHLASRRTIGAGTAPNTRGHLAGWIVDSQALKPGNLMPPVDINAEDLQALLDYLGTLR